MARILSQVVGHSEQIERLLASAQAEHLAHAFLFVGPTGVGKKLVATALAQALICEKSIQACGLCPSCHRVFKGHHENLMFIEPEKNQIRIEQSRSVLDFLSLRAIRGNRVIIVDEAHTLNPQAANSLLKILEEPQAGVFFFLIAPSADHVLPTIRSRSQVIQFHALSLDQLKSKSTAPEWALRAAQGSFAKLAMLQEKEEQFLREQAKVFLQAWLKQPQGYLNPQLREVFKDRTQGSSLSTYLSLFLRDAVYFKHHENEKIFNQDQKVFIKQLSEQDENRLLQASHQALMIPSQLQANRDAALVFEEFWIGSRQD